MKEKKTNFKKDLFRGVVCKEDNSKTAGITLIALVITIIILIIISSVSIGIILGNNGLIDRVKTAKKEYQNSVDEENRRLEEIYSKLLLADANGTSLENVDMTTLRQLILDTTYPVGSIYLTINNQNPSTIIGGEWQQVGQGRALYGAGDLNDVEYTADETIDAGLPNITGNFGILGNGAIGSNMNVNYADGAFSAVRRNGYRDAYTDGNNGNATYYANFNAQNSNAIYGNSQTVQPNAYVTYMWKRTK